MPNLANQAPLPPEPNSNTASVSGGPQLSNTENTSAPSPVNDQSNSLSPNSTRKANTKKSEDPVLWANKLCLNDVTLTEDGLNIISIADKHLDHKNRSGCRVEKNSLLVSHLKAFLKVNLPGVSGYRLDKKQLINVIVKAKNNPELATSQKNKKSSSNAKVAMKPDKVRSMGTYFRVILLITHEEMRPLYFLAKQPKTREDMDSRTNKDHAWKCLLSNYLKDDVDSDSDDEVSPNPTFTRRLTDPSSLNSIGKDNLKNVKNCDFAIYSGIPDNIPMNYDALDANDLRCTVDFINRKYKEIVDKRCRLSGHHAHFSEYIGNGEEWLDFYHLKMSQSSDKQLFQVAYYHLPQTVFRTSTDPAQRKRKDCDNNSVTTLSSTHTISPEKRKKENDLYADLKIKKNMAIADVNKSQAKEIKLNLKYMESGTERNDSMRSYYKHMENADKTERLFKLYATLRNENMLPEQERLLLHMKSRLESELGIMSTDNESSISSNSAGTPSSQAPPAFIDALAAETNIDAVDSQITTEPDLSNNDE